MRIVSVLVLLTATACASGGSVKVRLASSPAGTRMVLVPRGDWDRKGREALLRKPDALADYPHGVTPTTLHARDYVYVVICGSRVVGEIRPQLKEENAFEFDCTQPPLANPSETEGR